MCVVTLFVIMILVNFNVTSGRMEGNIVGGHFSKMEDFAYNVFLSIECEMDDRKHFFICGSSIVNQIILLTAAHCLEECKPTSVIVAHSGSANKYKGSAQSTSKFQMHKEFVPSPIANDIALVKLKRSLQFGKYVKRISLMPKPPYFEQAMVAGWGTTDEKYMNRSNWLKYANQKVWTHQACIEKMTRLPDGAFCAGALHSTTHAARYFIVEMIRGDSGSPLVVRKFIQIGLVSFRTPQISKSLVVYTDTGYFYNWIKKESKKLYCSRKT